MKLISLNTWGGKLLEPLLHFLVQKKDTTDIFCLQEIFHEEMPSAFSDVHQGLFNDIEKALPNFQGFFAAPDNPEGLAIFVKKERPFTYKGNFMIIESQVISAENNSRSNGRNIQILECEEEGKFYTMFNFHGIWMGGEKEDTESRLEQSRNVKKFMDATKGAKILCGDFNLSPDTKSLAILEEGMRNLIEEYGITSTRSEHYKKENKFADYMIISPDVNVIAFEVLQDAVSDHLPLYLEFS